MHEQAFEDSTRFMIDIVEELHDLWAGICRLANYTIHGI